MKQFDSSLIPTEAMHDFHHCSTQVPCDDCWRMFIQDEDETLCSRCAHGAIEDDIEEMIATVAAISHAEKDYAWKYGYLASFVASMAQEIPECLDYLAARKISA